MFKIILFFMIIIVVINFYIDIKNKINTGKLMEGMLPGMDNTYSLLKGQACISDGKYRYAHRLRGWNACMEKCDSETNCVGFATKGWSNGVECYTYDKCEPTPSNRLNGFTYYKRKNNTAMKYKRKSVNDAYVLPNKVLKSEKAIQQICSQYSYLCSGYYKDKRGDYRAFIKLTDELKKTGMYPYTTLIDKSNGQEVYYRSFKTPEEEAAAENGTNNVLKKAVKPKFDKYNGFHKESKKYYTSATTPCDQDEFVKTLREGEGYFWNPYHGKGYCEKIYKDNVENVRKGYGTDKWASRMDQVTNLPLESKATLDSNKLTSAVGGNTMNKPEPVYSYYSGKLKSNKCNIGDEIVDSRKECVKAAKYLNLKSDWVGGSNNPGNLRDCFSESGIVRFNYNKNQKKDFTNPNMRPICKKIDVEATELKNSVHTIMNRGKKVLATNSGISGVLSKIAETINNSINLNVNTHSHDGNNDLLKNIDHMFQPNVNKNNIIPENYQQIEKNSIVASQKVDEKKNSKIPISGRTTNMLGNTHKYSYYTQSYKPMDPNVNPKPLNSILTYNDK